MKIKKVDEKPVVIHKKKKVRIHYHVPKQSVIKGKNIYTREVKKAVKAQKNTKVTSGNMHKSRESRGNALIDTDKNKSISPYRKKKDKSHEKGGMAGNMSLAYTGTKAVSEQIEGGEEVHQAAYTSYVLSKPLNDAASKGAGLMKRKSADRKKRRINSAGTVSKTNGVNSKQPDEEKGKYYGFTGNTYKSHKKDIRSASEARKNRLKIRERPPFVNKASYTEHTKPDERYRTLRKRKINVFIESLKKNSGNKALGKIKRQSAFKAGKVIATLAPVAVSALLLVVLLASVTVVPVMAIVGEIYNSPFAIFLPPLDDGESVTTVASAYLAEFNRDINTLVKNHEDCDTGKIRYVDFEGIGTPNNYYDVLGVYMVYYGVGDTAAEMNKKGRKRLQGVFDDMCTYTTSAETETVEVKDAEGNTESVTRTVLYVNVELKTWHDMVDEYGFDAEEQVLISDFMSSDYLHYLGYSPSGATGSVKDELSDSEINFLLLQIPDYTRKSVCEYLLRHVGYPYSRSARDSGTHFDASSLAYYAWQSVGTDLSHDGVYNAAAIAEGLYEADCAIEYEDIQAGDLIFYSTACNGRFKDITHMAVYMGNEKAVEAINEYYGVVYQDVRLKDIVLICSPE